MPKLVWSDQFNLGIDVIDQQHRTIMDYVNQFYDARSRGSSHKDIVKLVKKIVDYTMFHFTFEEDIQEKAGYPFLKPHKKTHALIAQHVSDFQSRFENGDDVSSEVDGLLSKWLFDHLKHDDSDYVKTVSEYLRLHPEALAQKTGIFARIFK